MFGSMFDLNDRFRSMEREMDRLLYARPRAAGVRFSLRDEGKALCLTAEIPGIADHELELSIDQNVLVLKAERKSAVPSGARELRRERPALSFHEAIELPVRVDETQVEAVLKDGLLTVTLPKAKEAQPRRIAVGAPKAELS